MLIATTVRSIYRDPFEQELGKSSSVEANSTSISRYRMSDLRFDVEKPVGRVGEATTMGGDDRYSRRIMVLRRLA